MKLVVEVFLSKKTNKQCAALCLDLGYRKAFLSFDPNLVAECLECSVREVYELEIGTYNVN